MSKRDTPQLGNEGIQKTGALLVGENKDTQNRTKTKGLAKK